MFHFLSTVVATVVGFALYKRTFPFLAALWQDTNLKETVKRAQEKAKETE